MSESGNEKPKDRKNVFSFVDKSEQKKRKERKKQNASSKPSDLIDYSVFDDPDKVRRRGVVIKAGKMLDALRSDPALSTDAIAEERGKLPQDIQSISDLIESSAHQQWIREPNRFWAMLDIFFKPLDVLAETVVDQFSAELDVMTRFKSAILTNDDWIRSRSVPISSMPEERPFQESLKNCTEDAQKRITSSLVQSLDEYLSKTLGITAPLLLALVNEYKNRRKLP